MISSELEALERWVNRVFYLDLRFNSQALVYGDRQKYGYESR